MKITLRIKIQSKLKATVHGDSTLKQAALRAIAHQQSMPSLNVGLALPLPFTQFSSYDQPTIKFGLLLHRWPISAAAGKERGVTT